MDAVPGKGSLTQRAQRYRVRNLSDYAEIAPKGDYTSPWHTKKHILRVPHPSVLRNGGNHLLIVFDTGDLMQEGKGTGE